MSNMMTSIAVVERKKDSAVEETLRSTGCWLSLRRPRR